MRSSRGFTLIELIVSIAIMAIIMGTLVQLFGTSVTAELTGFNQQEMYAQARNLENDLKNTLRYTVDQRKGTDSVKFLDQDGKTITGGDRSGAAKLTYTALIYNNAQKRNQKIEVELSWADTSTMQKQLKMVKTTSNEAIDDKGNISYENVVTASYLFPENKDNSVFDSSAAFPVTVVDGPEDIHAGMLKIALPFRYKFGAGEYKTNMLETKVAFQEADVSTGAMGVIGLDNTSWWTYDKLNSLNSNSILAGPNADVYNVFVMAMKLKKAGFQGKVLISSDKLSSIKSLYQYTVADQAEKDYVLEHIQDKVNNKTLDEYIIESGASIVRQWKINSSENPYNYPGINEFSYATGLYICNGLTLKDKNIVLNGETVAYLIVNSATLQNTTISGKGTIILYEQNAGIYINNLKTGNDVKLILMSDSNTISIINSSLNNTIINARDANLLLKDVTIGGTVYSKVNIDFDGNIILNDFPSGKTSALEAGKSYFN